MNMSGNTILITGGATGIGYAMAEWFLNAGNEVIICGRREERLREAREKLPSVRITTCDVAEDAGRKELVEWATSRFGGLNILVNNAGVQRDIDFSGGAGEYEAHRDEIAINLEAPIMLSGLFIPHFLRKERAAIVNVTSGLGFVPAARMPVYSATKAGLHAFTMALRHQLRNSPIRVFELVPPAVDSELNREGRIKRGNFRPPLSSADYVAGALPSLANDTPESGFGPSAEWIRASREDLDRHFTQMNSRW
ncbi:MAG TPA: SDR family NAD(P)-dependent oxidoreductase [Bacteroidota bacterium]|nr:SDR family NAD(P)-dependent oxidoreductase [Bacteroidota bacterium]